MRMILALDIGLSFCKASLFSKDGTERGRRVAPTPLLTPSKERSEMDMERLWQLAASLIRELLMESGGSGVSAIGVSGHGNGLYCLDAEGAPLGNAVTSMDRRAAIEVQSIPAACKAVIERISTQRIWAGQPGMILRWMKRNEPGRFAKVKAAMLCKDYLSYKLCGKLALDWSDASAAGLLDTDAGKWSHELFDALELPGLADKLPPLMRSFDIRGGVSKEASLCCGLQEGTPVIGGMFDVDACLYGAGAPAPGLLGCIAGTWNINAAFSGKAVRSSRILQCVRRGDASSFMLIDSSASSAVNIEWLLRSFFNGRHDYAWLEAAYEGRVAGLDRESPFWLPLVAGSIGAASNKGAWVGVGLGHSSADLAMSVAEGICFAHRFHIENLLAAGASSRRVRLTGGAARPWLCRLFADVTGLPVESCAGVQGGAAGIKLAAGVALGRFKTLHEAYAAEGRRLQEFLPRPELGDLFDSRYEHFKELLSCRL